MKHITHSEILEMDQIERLNLINSCTGYKSANLLGSISPEGVTNVAIFSSVTHLGSNPPLLGFVLRPTSVPRNTFDNIKRTGEFTVNHIHAGMITDAHHTSAKYPGHVSEFDKTGLKPQFRDCSSAPFVAGAKIQLGCRYKNQYVIEENGCLFIVASIEHIFFENELQLEDGFLALDEADSVTVNGLDGYALPKLIDRFEYARPE